MPSTLLGSSGASRRTSVSGWRSPVKVNGAKGCPEIRATASPSTSPSTIPNAGPDAGSPSTAYLAMRTGDDHSRTGGGFGRRAWGHEGPRDRRRDTPAAAAGGAPRDRARRVRGRDRAAPDPAVAPPGEQRPGVPAHHPPRVAGQHAVGRPLPRVHVDRGGRRAGRAVVAGDARSRAAVAVGAAV